MKRGVGRRWTLTGIALLLAMTARLGWPSAQAVQPKQNIAHRGASAYAPEHTLAAYRLAVDQRADYVEQDLAVTRDGQLVCLHDDTLERTTNVEQVFPTRATPGEPQRWNANDFTLAEVKRLDAGTWFHAKFAGERVPTFQEAIDLVRGRAGLYPELKSPPLYAGRGVDMVKIFAEVVRRNGLDRADSRQSTPIIVQSFDEPTIRRLAAELPDVPRVLLLESFPTGGLTEARLREIARVAHGIGPAKRLLELQPSIVKMAQDVGLTVTAYTFRSRDPEQFAALRHEMARFLFQLGIDALFTDNPDLFPR
jgi:glycerophosphoryl diester phosphodiesterase